MNAVTNTVKNTYKVAIPKGRVEMQITQGLEAMQYTCYRTTERKLFYEVEELDLCVIPLKNDDIVRFLEAGLVDFAVLGRDIVDEGLTACEVWKNLNLGRCRMSLAGLADYKLSEQRHIRVATKYPNQARLLLKHMGMQGEVIPMCSSVELAPLLGIADAVLDVVETGTTLKENGLKEWFMVNPIVAQIVLSKNWSNQNPLPPALIRAMNGFSEF